MKAEIELTSAQHHQIDRAMAVHADAMGVFDLVIERLQDANDDEREHFTGLAVWVGLSMAGSWQSLKASWEDAIAASKAEREKEVQMREAIYETVAAKMAKRPQASGNPD